MFKAKIIAGCWEEGTIELSGMPKDFVLSARTLIVMEESEYDTLKAKAELLDGAVVLAEVIKRLYERGTLIPKVTAQRAEDLLLQAKELSK